MVSFAWKSAYEIGSEEIDSQHKQLLVLAHQLYLAVGQGKEKQVIKPAFDALLAYTRKHFADEEALFESWGCRDLEAHRKQHAILEDEVMSLWQEEAMGLSDDVGRILEKWVETRLVPHMTVEDQGSANACTRRPD